MLKDLKEDLSVSGICQGTEFVVLGNRRPFCPFFHHVLEAVSAQLPCVKQ